MRLLLVKILIVQWPLNLPIMRMSKTIVFGSKSCASTPRLVAATLPWSTEKVFLLPYHFYCYFLQKNVRPPKDLSHARQDSENIHWKIMRCSLFFASKCTVWGINTAMRFMSPITIIIAVIIMIIKFWDSFNW